MHRIEKEMGVPQSKRSVFWSTLSVAGPVELVNSLPTTASHKGADSQIARETVYEPHPNPRSIVHVAASGKNRQIHNGGEGGGSLIPVCRRDVNRPVFGMMRWATA